MRKVIAYELLSLDGVAEEPNEFITEWDDAMDENLRRVIAPQDTVLLGHRTYDDWAAFWPAWSASKQSTTSSTKRFKIRA